jgi:hypothetical protein
MRLRYGGWLLMPMLWLLIRIDALRNTLIQGCVAYKYANYYYLTHFFKVQIIFYERFFNFEVMSGGMLVANTEWSRKFLMDYGNYEKILPRSWHGNDNGAIHMHLLRTLMPYAKNAIRFAYCCNFRLNSSCRQCNNLWSQAINVDYYYRFVVCVRTALGANRIFEPYVKLIRRLVTLSTFTHDLYLIKTTEVTDGQWICIYLNTSGVNKCLWHTDIRCKYCQQL